MKVKDVLFKFKRPTVTITGDKTIQEAMKLMVDYKIGSVVVVETGNYPVGIVTERDIFRLCHQCQGAMMTMKVADHMTTDLAVGLPDDDLDYIAGVITHKRVRHIPIIDAAGKLCGLISIGDIVKAKLTEAEVHVRYLTEYITGRSQTGAE